MRTCVRERSPSATVFLGAAGGVTATGGFVACGRGRLGRRAGGERDEPSLQPKAQRQARRLSKDQDDISSRVLLHRVEGNGLTCAAAQRPPYIHTVLDSELPAVVKSRSRCATLSIAPARRDEIN